MDTKRNTLSPIALLADARAGLRELAIERPTAWLAEARAKFENLPQTNFDLGCHFAALGKWTDALFRFRVTAYVAPEFPKVWYNIGCCYHRLNKPAQAEEALKKALQQRPDHAEALLMLAAINPTALSPSQLPKRMPSASVIGFFTSIAEGYDVAEAQAKYQGGIAVHTLVAPQVAAPAPRVVDLGCGTGIAARPWRHAAGTIIGVDVTPGMVAIAAGARHSDKQLYDRLITADLSAPVADLPAGEADLVLCVNSSQFMGDLGGLMENAARALAPGGLFVLTYEPHSGQGYGLSLQTGRFGHATDYIHATAKAAGLSLANDARIALYAETETPASLFRKIHG